MSRSATTSNASERPARHVFVRRLPYVVLAWLVFALVQWLLSRIALRSIGGPSSILFRLSTTFCWTLLTLGIWAWVDLLDRSRRSRLTTFAAHALGVATASVIDGLWRYGNQLLLDGKPAQALGPLMLYFLDLTIVAYAAVVVLKRVADAQDAVVRQERRQLTLRTQLAHAQLGYLETQLQPHFLFNSLGAVLELAHEAPATAARMLRQLAALLRFAVHGRGQTVTLAEELGALEPYLEIQRLRFADWLTISRHATPDALRVSVPRMTLQPLVENAIRHGLAGRTERGHIAIDAAIEGSALRLRVSDNGVGLGPQAEAGVPGIGLRNLSHRLRTLYGETSSVSLRKAPGGGAVTEVRFRADVAPSSAGPPGVAATDAGERAPTPLSDLFRRHPYASIAVGWLVWGSIWVQLNIVWMSVTDARFMWPTWRLVSSYGLGVLAWAALTPIMLAVARRNSLVRGPRWWRVALHTGFACGFALAQIAAWQWLASSRRRLWSPEYIETMLWTAMLYALLVGLSSYHEFSEWLSERETATARLRAELAEAELTSAAMRFDPEAVLARLEQIEAIVQVDAEAAEHALTGLADHLRRSLDTAREMPRTMVAWQTHAGAR